MRRMKLYAWLALIVSSSSYAAIEPNALPQWYVDLGMGLGFSEHAHSRMVSNGAGYPSDTYQGVSLNNTTEMAFSGGREWLVSEHYMNIGLLYETGLNPQTHTGIIDEFSLPGYDNYTYYYKVTHETFLVTGEWNLLTTHYIWQPYLTVGLGLSENQAYDYTEIPNAGMDSPRHSMGFANHRSTDLAFLLGVGVKYSLTQNWQLDANYHYLSAGTASLGASIADETGLKQSLNYNIFMAGVRYMF